MNIAFIVNNKKNRLVKALPVLKQDMQQFSSFQVQFLFTEYKKHAIEIARQAVTNNYEYIIAVGGDGTLNEVINGVMQSNVPTKDLPIIGLLPYGSANDFARTTLISKSTEQLMQLIKTHSYKIIDLGKISAPNSEKTTYFINISGVGLGPEVVKKMEKSSGRLGAGFNYFNNIIKGFLSYTKKEVSCISKDWQWKGKLLQMAIANGRYYGNAICTAPDAKLTDGQFQVVIFGDLSIWDYLKNINKLKKGIKINLPQVHYYQSKEITILSNDGCGIEADGEYVGLAPVTLKIVPAAIRFLVPEEVY